MNNKKNTLKKASVKITIVFAILLAVCLILSTIYYFLSKDKQNGEIIASDHEFLTMNFRSYFPADFDLKLSEDTEYLKLDRLIHYSSPNGQTFAVEQLDSTVLNEGQRFFIKYFDVTKNGKCDLYASLFTKQYKKTPVGFEKNPSRKFSPQRIYDISVRELARTDKNNTSFTYDGKPCVFGYYIVDFKIFKNDGLFRRDFNENASRPLVFELVTFDAGTNNEKTYIKNIYLPSDGNKDN